MTDRAYLIDIARYTNSGPLLSPTRRIGLGGRRPRLPLDYPLAQLYGVSGTLPHQLADYYTPPAPPKRRA